MWGFSKGLAGFASFCLTTLVMVGGAAVTFFDSNYGQAFLDRRTEDLVERLLGPGYDASLGRQSVLLRGGRIGFQWNDVIVRRAGATEPQISAHSIALGFDALPLLRGRLAVRTLDVSGVEIDVTNAPSASEVAAAAQGLVPTEGRPAVPPIKEGAAKALLPALSNRLFGQAEQQLAVLQRVGIDEVNVADVRLTAPIAPGGGPFVSYVERLKVDLGDPRNMRLAGTLRLNELDIPIDTRLDFDPAAKRIVSGRSDIGPIAIERLLPPGKRNDTKDVRPFGSDTTLKLALDLASKPEGGPRTVRLAASFGGGHIHQGRGHTDFESGSVALDYVEGDDVVRLGPNRFSGDLFDASFSGELAPLYDRPDGGFNGFGLKLASERLRSAVGSTGRVPTDGSLRLSGRTNLSSQEAVLNEIDLRAGAGMLTGNVAFRYGEPDAGLRLHLALSDLTASAVKALWPFDIAIAARRWVHENVGDEGGLRSGTIDFRASKQRMVEASRPRGKGYQPGELDLNFVLHGLTVGSFGELPKLRDAEGTVDTHGGDTLVTVARADVDGVAGAIVEGGLVTLSRIDGTLPPQTRIALNANIASDLAKVVEATERAPLNAVVDLPIMPEDALGKAKTTADVVLVTGDDLPNGRTIESWRVRMALSDAGSKGLLGGRRIENVSGTLDVERSSLAGEFDASVDGAKGSVRFRRWLGTDTPDKRRMEASLRVDAAEATKLAPLLTGVISGPIEAELTEDLDQRFRADLNLSASILDMPWLGWRKGKGIPTRLAFAVRRNEKETVIDDIALKGDGFSASGRATADAEGLREADLADIALNPGDDVHATLDRVQNGYSVAITGRRFDARPLLADIRNDLGAKTAAPPRRGNAQFDVSAALERVEGFGGETISDFALNYAGSGSNIAALSIGGRGARNAPFSIDVSPRGEDRSIEIRTENAGALIDFTGAYGRMQGGKLTLSLVGTYDDGYSGKLEAKNFALVDEPRLSRLVSAQATPGTQSLSQAVGRNLRTERASFDHASAGIDFGKDGLRLSDGIIRGPDFGSSFAGQLYDPKNRIDISGSFMPAYGLNRVFGAIPVVGQILGNGREGGLIGITYRLSGSFSAPKLEVNPISAIAPGIFRNIFAYQ